MLIQNVTGNSVPTPSVIHDNAGLSAVSASAPQTVSKPVELPQALSLHVASAQTAQPSSTQLQEAIDKLNQAMFRSNTNLEFSIDEGTKQPLIKVVDSNTGETIRQFPSKEVIAISQSIDQFQKGLLLRQKA
jgi:flagellar protein FlaG